MSFVKVTKEFLMLVKEDLDQYTTQKSTIKVNNFLSLTLFTPSHIQFARYGRGPGKPPPIDPIMKWLSQKGIVKDAKQAKGTAIAIAKSIGKNGTSNYVPNAPNALEQAIQKHLKSYVTSVNNKHVKKTVDDLEKVYKKNLKTFTVNL